MNTHEIFQLVSRQRMVMGGVFVASMVAAAAGLAMQTPRYEAAVKILISAKKQVESPYYKDIGDARLQDIIFTQSEIVRSKPVLERAVKTLRLNQRPPDYERRFASLLKSLAIDFRAKLLAARLDRMESSQREKYLIQKAVEELQQNISVEPIPETNLFNVVVRDFDPRQAALIANVVSRSYVIFDLEQQLMEVLLKYGELHQTVKQLKDNIDDLKFNLSNESSFSNVEALGPASVKIIEQAGMPVEPVGVSRLLIFVAALIFGCAAAGTAGFLFDVLDPTFRTPQEVEKHLGLPVLGVVPRRRFFLVECLRLGRNVLAAAIAASCALWIVRAAVTYSYPDPPANVPAPLARFFWLSPEGRKDCPIYRQVLKHGWPAVAASGAAAVVVVIAFAAAGTFALRIVGRRAYVRADRVQPRGAFGRAVRQACERLYVSMKKHHRSTLLFVSALRGEGTTTVAAQTAAYLAAASGAKVLVIDADLRSPALHKAFGLSRGQGLTDILKRDVPLEAAARTVTGLLHVVSAGTEVMDPLVLLNSDRMRDFIRRMQANYDFVLLDCASLQDSMDAHVLAAQVDAAVIVVREGYGRRAAARAAAAQLKHEHLTVAGAILNASRYRGLRNG